MACQREDTLGPIVARKADLRSRNSKLITEACADWKREDGGVPLLHCPTQHPKRSLLPDSSSISSFSERETPYRLRVRDSHRRSNKMDFRIPPDTDPRVSQLTGPRLDMTHRNPTAVPWKKTSCSAFMLGLLLVVTQCPELLAIKLITISVPSHPIVGDTVTLRCVYDMDGSDLYSVKWYKGGSEFYRYMPKDKPPAQIYNVVGIKVDREKSNRDSVTLRSVELSTSGLYRCEISAEAPSFSTVFGESDMLVIDLPEEGPKISGTQLKYDVGDTVNVNCTSARSKPAAILEWTINEEKPPKEWIREYNITIDSDILETTVLGLSFQVPDDYLKDGELKFRCSATIAPVYHQTNEERVSGRSRQATRLESRDANQQDSGAVDISYSFSCLALSVMIFLAFYCKIWGEL